MNSVVLAIERQESGLCCELADWNSVSACRASNILRHKLQSLTGFKSPSHTVKLAITRGVVASRGHIWTGWHRSNGGFSLIMRSLFDERASVSPDPTKRPPLIGSNDERS